MLQNIILIAAGVLAGVVTALQYIAPKVHNAKVDAVLAKLESIEALVLKVSPPALPPAPPAP